MENVSNSQIYFNSCCLITSDFHSTTCFAPWENRFERVMQVMVISNQMKGSSFNRTLGDFFYFSDFCELFHIHFIVTTVVTVDDLHFRVIIMKRLAVVITHLLGSFSEIEVFPPTADVKNVEQRGMFLVFYVFCFYII